MKYFDEQHLLIAMNQNHWSWEYDSFTVTASLIFNINNGNIYLDLEKSHYKSGLGKGRTTNKVCKPIEVGTLKKPLKREIIKILKENKLQEPFPRNGWFTGQNGDDPVKYQMNITEAIENFKNYQIVKRILKLKKIKKIMNF